MPSSSTTKSPFSRPVCGPCPTAQLQYRLLACAAALLLTLHTRADDKPPVPYKQVQPIFAKHCLSCHDAKEAEGKLVMETYASLMKGGEDGPAIVPGKAEESPLIQLVEHKEKPFMPPPKKGDKLSTEEIALLRRWIDFEAPWPALA